MTGYFGATIDIHSKGILKYPILEGIPISGQSIESGTALSFLSFTIEFYENLRVRDIFQMLLEYPELLIVVPYLDKVVDVYKNYPKILITLKT